MNCLKKNGKGSWPFAFVGGGFFSFLVYPPVGVAFVRYDEGFSNYHYRTLHIISFLPLARHR